MSPTKTITITATDKDSIVLDTITLQIPADHLAVEVVLTNSQMGKYGDHVLVIGQGSPD
jgi:hypothetical protein